MGKLVSSVANIFTGADKTAEAAQQASARQEEAARVAAIASQFRPVGMTTRFGSSQFTREIDPRTGMPYVSSASYTAAPELAALQDRLFGSFASSLPSNFDYLNPLETGASRAFGLGEQYLATSPQQAEQDYMNRTMALLAPQREQELASVRNRVFQTGRSGLGVGGTTTGRLASNPELAALYNARNQQDLEIAQRAIEQGQARQQFGLNLYNQGAGLFGLRDTLRSQAYSPLQTVLGTAGQVENLSQMPFQLGVQLGTSALPGQTAGAQMYNQGISNAANTAYQGIAGANAANAGFWSGVLQGGATLYGGSQGWFRPQTGGIR